MSGEGGSLSEEDLDVGPDELVSGHFQSVSLESGHDMSVYVPYLVRDPITGFIQNSTVIDIEKGGFLQSGFAVPAEGIDAVYAGGGAWEDQLAGKGGESVVGVLVGKRR
tara:strand:- start:1069 stop:1395 length:327 start_codon:yes stop_codon:yes gene_type:complete